MPRAYRTPDECFAAVPDWPYEPRYLVQDDLRIHFVEDGAGDPILLLHGEPTWGFLYRKLVPALAGVGRVVVPDLVGFGRSDKPLKQTEYTYEAHVRWLTGFVRELDLRRLTLVVHDWGGPIGLRLAVEEPERVDRLVLLNTGVGVGAPSELWLRFRELVRRAGPDFTASRLVQASCVTRLADAVLEAYDAPFPSPKAKAGALAFPELVPTEIGHPSADAMLEVRRHLAGWAKPALVLFSDSDRVFSPEHAERLSKHIPGALPAEIVAGGGHFLQEDCGAELGARIARFVRET